MQEEISAHMKERLQSYIRHLIEDGEVLVP